MEGTHNFMLDLEDLPESELRKLQERIHAVSEQYRDTTGNVSHEMSKVIREVQEEEETKVTKGHAHSREHIFPPRKLHRR